MIDFDRCTASPILPRLLFGMKILILSFNFNFEQLGIKRESPVDLQMGR